MIKVVVYFSDKNYIEINVKQFNYTAKDRKFWYMSEHNIFITIEKVVGISVC